MAQRAGLIGLVTPGYAPIVGGVERHVGELATGLARRGVAVEVLTTDPSGSLPPIEERDGVLVRRFRTLGRQRNYFVAPGLGRWLDRSGSRYVLLHAHSYHALPALQAAAASHLNGTPLLFTPHYHGTGHTPLRRLLHVPYRPVGAWLVRQARMLICVSESERALLQAHFGPRLDCTVIPNGVEVDHLLAAAPLPQPEGRRVLLAVGRLEAYKQFDRLVAALPHLPPAFHAVIVGEGPELGRLRARSVELGVAERVRLTGRIPAAELGAWYRTASVVASLSRHEAFGITLLEGAAAGAAVVASDIPAHREVAGYLSGRAPTLVDPDCEPAHLARVVAALAAHPRPPAGAAGLPTWTGMIDQTMRCYYAAARLPAPPLEVHHERT